MKSDPFHQCGVGTESGPEQNPVGVHSLYCDDVIVMSGKAHREPTCEDEEAVRRRTSAF